MSPEKEPSSEDILAVLRRAVSDEAQPQPLVLTSSQRVNDAVPDSPPPEDETAQMIDHFVDEIAAKHLKSSTSTNGVLDREIEAAIKKAVKQELSTALGRFVKAELRKAIQKEVAQHLAGLTRKGG